VIVSSFLFTSEIKNKVVKQHQLQTLWSIFFNQILSWSSFGGNNWFNICNICFWQWLEKLLSKTDDYSFLTSDLTTHSNYRTKRIQQYSHPEPHRTTSMLLSMFSINLSKMKEKNVKDDSSENIEYYTNSSSISCGFCIVLYTFQHRWRTEKFWQFFHSLQLFWALVENSWELLLVAVVLWYLKTYFNALSFKMELCFLSLS